MMLLTKSIFDPVSPEDGFRASVMSRHTLEDGATPGPRIINESYNLWHPELSPGDKEVGAFCRALRRGATREQLWPEFSARYLARLKGLQQSAVMTDYASLASGPRNITLLCAEPLSMRPYCHRFLMADEMLRRHPRLEVRHL